MAKHNVGGRKQEKATEKTLAGTILAWAKRRKHTIDTDLKSANVMFSVQDETSTPSKKNGKHRIMFTVFGKDVENCTIWLNAFSRNRGSEEKATKSLLPNAKWGTVDINVRSGANFLPKNGYLPKDGDLDYIFEQCKVNVPEKATKTKTDKKVKKTKATKKNKKAKKAKTTKAEEIKKAA